MMNISFTCHGCGKPMAALPTMAGKRVKCRACGTALTIPEGTAPASSSPAFDDDDLYAMSAPSALPPRPPVARPSGAGAPRKGKPKGKAARKSDGMGFWERQTLIFRTPWGIGALILLGIVLWQDIPGWRKAAQEGREQAAARAATQDAGGTPSRRIPPVSQASAPKPLVVPTGEIVLPVSPDLGPAVAIEPGIVMHEVEFGPKPAPTSAPPGHSTRLWIYLPSGDHAAKSLPCVMIAPAGSNMLSGMELGQGDRAEHLPWVREGFVVVAYDLDGPVENPIDKAEFQEAMRRFFAARGGFTNAHIALEYALEKLPMVDPSRIVAVGHSSAGTVAMLLATRDPRIAACVTFAAEVGLRAELFTRAPNQNSPGFGDFLDLVSKIDPSTFKDALKSPVFVFFARDDEVVSPGAASNIASALGNGPAPGSASKTENVASGGHYDAMINEGIPMAIAWVKGLTAFTRSD